MFHWLPKEHMCVLVYLVTVMHSMQAGYMDKAQKYTDKALLQIEKLKILDSHPILSSFQLMLLEHIIMCRLVMGQKSLAVQEVSCIEQWWHLTFFWGGGHRGSKMLRGQKSKNLQKMADICNFFSSHWGKSGSRAWLEEMPLAPLGATTGVEQHFDSKSTVHFSFSRK